MCWQTTPPIAATTRNGIPSATTPSSRASVPEEATGLHGRPPGDHRRQSRNHAQSLHAAGGSAQETQRPGQGHRRHPQHHHRHPLLPGHPCPTGNHQRPLPCDCGLLARSWWMATNYTEEILNGFPSNDIEEKLDGDEYRLLIVANNSSPASISPNSPPCMWTRNYRASLPCKPCPLQPQRRRIGQAYRGHLRPGLLQQRQRHQSHLDPYYTATTLSQPTHVNVLHDLKDDLDAVGVYDWPEVESFNALYLPLPTPSNSAPSSTAVATASPTNWN